MISVYPGSFDPVTNGHLDIINRASNKFDKLIVGVLVNHKKEPLFSIEERIELIKKCTSHLKNVEVKSFSGLLVDFVESEKAHIIIRGLRAVSDFEYELQMALMNKRLKTEIETMFMMAGSDYAYLSSSMVKEVAKLNGNIKGLVPDEILEDINDIIMQKRLS